MGSIPNKFIVLTFSLAVILLVVIGTIDYYSTRSLVRISKQVAHTHEVLEDLESLLSELSTAEGGSRGYIITGNKAFLEPYHTALSQVDQRFKRVRDSTDDNPLQQSRIAKLEPLVNSRVNMLRSVVDIRANKGFEASQTVIALQRGMHVMDEIRDIIGDMKSEEIFLLRLRQERTSVVATMVTRFTKIGTLASVLLLLLSFYLLQREIKQRQRIQREVTTLNRYLEERAVQLESANKELEAFSYSVSHDLRAPIRHMSGFVDLLSKQESIVRDPKTGRYLKFIADSARQMGNLVDDLLSFSRMSRTEMHVGTVELDQLVKETRQELAATWSGRSIAWHMDPLPTVECDASMLRLVFVNLLTNAIKYTGTREQAEIGVYYSATPAEHVVSVRDNGVGFDMKYIDKLFGVFQRLHHSDEFEGTGIGLANVRRIINRHGGRTWAEGKVDGGATFYFTLPQKPNPQPAKPN